MFAHVCKNNLHVRNFLDMFAKHKSQFCKCENANSTNVQMCKKPSVHKMRKSAAHTFLQMQLSALCTNLQMQILVECKFYFFVHV